MRSFAEKFVGFAVVLVLSGCHIDIGDGVLSVSEDFEQTLATGASGSSLTLSNVNGRVEVSTWDRPEIKVEAEKLASSERALDRIEIEIDESGGDVTVRTRFAKGRFFSRKGKVNYRVTVPTNADVDVRTVNGKVALEGVGGRSEAETVNGSVEIVRARGEVVAATVNGSIRASYETLDEQGRNRFSTVNGGVRIGLAGDANGGFEARTVNGRIRSDFDELKATGRWGPKKLSGSLGSGGGSFKIKTVNGSVRIERHGANAASTEF